VARSSADFIISGQQLTPVPRAIQIARQGQRAIRQNLSWALLYNLVAIPFAALGWVAPWMAAIGMSASSLLVVLNAVRFGRSGPVANTRTTTAASAPETGDRRLPRGVQA